MVTPSQAQNRFEFSNKPDDLTSNVTKTFCFFVVDAEIKIRSSACVVQVRAESSTLVGLGLHREIRLNQKYLPRTNTTAYFAPVSVAKTKKFLEQRHLAMIPHDNSFPQLPLTLNYLKIFYKF